MHTADALHRFTAALDAAYGESGARFVIWLADDHDGDPAVYVRVILPDDDPRFERFADRLAMRRKVNDEAADVGLTDLVYTTFRSESEEAELASLA